MTDSNNRVPVPDTPEWVATVAEAVETFRRDGAVILRQAVAPEVVDRIRQVMQSADENSPFAGFIKGKVVVTSQENQQHHRFRFKDLYVNNRDAREAILSPLLIDVLNGISGEPVLAFQSLGFIRGSGLRVHRDSNFVVVDQRPESVIGTWLALEDIEEGMGELVYYPGSHRFPAYEMSEGSLQRVKNPGKISYSNDEYVNYLTDNIEAMGLEEKRFLAKKGDCLVWHADVVHAGSPVTRAGATRYSLATHFCPVSVRPNYFKVSKNATAVRHTDKVFFSSVHHNLKDIPDSAVLESRIVRPNIPPVVPV